MSRINKMDVLAFATLPLLDCLCQCNLKIELAQNLVPEYRVEDFVNVHYSLVVLVIGNVVWIGLGFVGISIAVFRLRGT